MKRIILLLILLFLLSPKTSSADEFDQYHKDYLKTYDKYYKTHQLYIIARTKYLTYKTLNAQKEALVATKEVMVVRDDVLISYFNTLNKRLDITGGVTKIQVDLEKELNDQAITFISGHKEKIASVAFLEDAVLLSEELEEKDIEFEKRGRKAASVILVGKANLLYGDLIELERLLKAKIKKLKEQGKDVNLLERWMLEFGSKKENAAVKIEEAKVSFNVIDGAKKADDVKDEFLKGQRQLLDSRQYVREAIMFAKELVTEAKKTNYQDKL